ncbi:Na+/H+ antiporter [Dactylosporangium matsuzakiense]|nr:Na+/H+ antiporter [Dactylosporangium matsuzakiense]UWZ43169.1 Na+/H+ antiporter [Dactylosporangium matsuzakiense]
MSGVGALEVVVALGAALVVAGIVARRVRIPPPVLLLIIGTALGLAPALSAVRLPPEAVLLLFLPALLYWESLTTSLREIRTNIRVIGLLSTALVVATAGGVAYVAHLLGVAWGPAWVLGAAVAPTDATAVSVLARGLPRRTTTVLRAESLVNDGTALAIFGLAMAVTIDGDELTTAKIGGLFALAYAGGVLAGLAAAWLALTARRLIGDEPLLANTVSLLTPFLAFLLAEVVHASGVLAVVACGLVISQYGPRTISARTRTQAFAFWPLTTFVLNGALFVLIGMQLPDSVRGLHDGTLPHSATVLAAVAATVVGVRFAWSFTTPYLIRALDRRPAQRLLRVGARARTISAIAGFRGAVSLAAALAVPSAVAERDLIVFVTSGVIVVTLGLGLFMPAVVRWARLPDDDGPRQELLLAQTTASQEALDALPGVGARLGVDDLVVARLRKEYERHLSDLHTGDDESDRAEQAEHEQYTMLKLELLAYKRATIVRLRDERRIDDVVLRQLQGKLDIEEVRLTGTYTTE